MTDNTVTLPVDVEHIQRLLPHRYPFLLVDRVVELEMGKRIAAIKNVTINEPFFQGHFPDHPVMPGVLIVEALAQAAGVLFQLSAPGNDENEAALYYLVRIDKARFNAMVVPGDQLRLEVNLKRLLRGMGIFEARALVGGDVVASCELMCAAGATTEGLMIDSTAKIDPAARLADDVEVGAYSIIGADVEIGAGTVIGPHVVIQGPTRIGKHNRFWQFASIGADAQDKKFAGEESRLEIGDDNVFREFVSVHRGTSGGGGVTRIGDDNWLLAYVHVAHDCHVGNHTVFSNYAALAGHVDIGDWVIVAGYAGVHQFCKVGAHAFIGMGCLVGTNVPPFVMMANEQHGRPRGINSEGLRRRGFDADRIAAIKRAYRTLYVGKRSMSEAREQLASQAADNEDVRAMLEFLEHSERAVAR